jgi:hypothetical protein
MKMSNDKQIAIAWWRELSLYEQTQFAKEVLGILYEFAWGSPAYILRIWQGKAAKE